MLENLIGKVVLNVIVDRQSDIVSIRTAEGTLTLEHFQDCCESVYIEDVIGDPQDMVGATVMVAEERTEDGSPNDCEMWTFYEFRTTKGDVTFRWNGSSNGYYSVSVSTTWRSV